MDRISKEQRSFTMSRIRSKNTKPEVLMFKALKESGIKFEKHYKLLGSPDIAFPKEKIAVFIDGDFWHGGKDFKSRENTLPKYWTIKIKKNVRRDRQYRSKLRKDGWKVIRIWEYRIMKNPNNCIKRVFKILSDIRQKEVVEMDAMAYQISE